MRAVADGVLRIVQQDQALRGDKGRMAQLIEEDRSIRLRRMTRLAVGRSWREATPTQRQR